MRIISFIFALTLLYSCTSGKEGIYVGSTPLHPDLRRFLGVSLTDSIDFMRWKLVIRSGQFELNCQYGIGKPNTNGFIHEKRVGLSGKVTRDGNYYALQQPDKTLWLVELNPNLLHLLDRNKNMLVGNGGWSYTLNSNAPVKTDQFNFPLQQSAFGRFMVFEGRTPCGELSRVPGPEKSSGCIKLKWLFVFYTDSLTGEPAGLLTGGTGYRKETMDKGRWEIIKGRDGRVTYKLYLEKRPAPLYLLKAGDAILVFTDPQGNLLVGNEDFSYTLNATGRRLP